MVAIYIYIYIYIYIGLVLLIKHKFTLRSKVGSIGWYKRHKRQDRNGV